MQFVILPGKRESTHLVIPFTIIGITSIQIITPAGLDITPQSLGGLIVRKLVVARTYITLPVNTMAYRNMVVQVGTAPPIVLFSMLEVCILARVATMTFGVGTSDGSAIATTHLGLYPQQPLSIKPLQK
jgi:hypothetical protein